MDTSSGKDRLPADFGTRFLSAQASKIEPLWCVSLCIPFDFRRNRLMQELHKDHWFVPYRKTDSLYLTNSLTAPDYGWETTTPVEGEQHSKGALTRWWVKNLIEASRTVSASALNHTVKSTLTIVSGTGDQPRVVP